MFIEEKLAAEGRISAATVSDADALKLVFGMGNKEAGAVRHAIASKAYRKMLAAAYKDGTLEAQESKAAWLQELCEKISFDAEEAMEVNLEQYVAHHFTHTHTHILSLRVDSQKNGERHRKRVADIAS